MEDGLQDLKGKALQIIQHHLDDINAIKILIMGHVGVIPGLEVTMLKNDIKGFDDYLNAIAKQVGEAKRPEDIYKAIGNYLEARIKGLTSLKSGQQAMIFSDTVKDKVEESLLAAQSLHKQLKP